MRTQNNFTFHIKAYGALTGHGVDPRSLPRDVQGLVSHTGDSRYAYIKEPSILRMLAQRLIDALAPLKRAGKLGFLVFQFPPWFTCRTSNFDYILSCKEMMHGLPIAAEFRHGSWLTADKAWSTFEFLGAHDITYVIADEPQYGNLSTIPFISQTTTDTAYFRFHGRNRENWLKKGIETSLRYAYSYSDEELADFAPSPGACGKEDKGYLRDVQQLPSQLCCCKRDEASRAAQKRVVSVPLARVYTDLHSRWTTQPSAGYPGRQRGAPPASGYPGVLRSTSRRAT